MKALWAGLIVLALVGCTEKAKTSDDQASASVAAAAAVAPPTHNYTDIENGLYLYAETLSDDQKKAGVAAAGFVALKFLGFKDGTYYLQDENSSVIFSCADPCTIIRQTLNGQVINRVQYNPNTIIGAAFTDAMNGQLNLYTQFKDPAVNTSDKAILDKEADLNEKCRGGSGDDPATQTACDQRDAVDKQLTALGYCYGEYATDGATSGWAKCSGTAAPKAQF